MFCSGSTVRPSTKLIPVVPKKIRVVFGMVDENKTSMAWYLFSSDGVARAKGAKAPPKRFGHRDAGGRNIQHTFKKKIRLDELAANLKGTPADLTLDVSDAKRFIECRIDKLTTKAKETVSFPFGLQYDSDPSRTGTIHGTVSFLEAASFDAKQFPLGPQGKAAQAALFGP
jgi:hypothetical protein